MVLICEATQDLSSFTPTPPLHNPNQNWAPMKVPFVFFQRWDDPVIDLLVVCFLLEMTPQKNPESILLPHHHLQLIQTLFLNHKVHCSSNLADNESYMAQEKHKKLTLIIFQLNELSYL